jgi:hypothetical protein
LKDEIEKKNFNYIKGLKIAIKIIMVKIKKKLYIWLKDKIEKKNQFSKKTKKKSKEWGSKST